MKPLTDKEARLYRAMERAALALNPKRGTADSAKAMYEAFGLPSASLEAGLLGISRMCKLPSALALSYSIIPAVARHIFQEKAEGVHRILNIEDARTILTPLYIGTHYECGYLLCMDAGGKLLRLQPLRMGTVDEAPLYTRITIEYAIESGGRYFILAHNHPAGTKEPSNADISSTQLVLDAMHRLDMVLIDHVIMAEGQAVSMRGYDRRSAQMWDRYAPLPQKYQNWPD